MNGENIKENRKLILLIIVLVLTLVVAITGATYAFFSVLVNSGEYVTGSSAFDANTLALEVTQLSAGNGLLIPLDDASIQDMASGSGGTNTCINNAGDTVCKVYSIKITNNSKVKINVAATLTFTASNLPNLKWAKGTSAIAGFPSTASGPFYSTFNTYTSNTSSTTQTNFLADDLLDANGSGNNSKTYYIVVWISDTGSVQNDNGKFVGTVNFVAYTKDTNDNKIEMGGITSAFSA